MGEGVRAEQALFFAAEQSEMDGALVLGCGEESGDFEHGRDSAGVIVCAGGSGLFRPDAEVQTIEVSGENDAAVGASGEGSDHVGSESGFGDAAAFGHHVVHGFDFDPGDLAEVSGDPFGGLGASVAEGIARGESAHGLDGGSEAGRIRHKAHDNLCTIPA